MAMMNAKSSASGTSCRSPGRAPYNITCAPTFSWLRTATCGDIETVPTTDHPQRRVKCDLGFNPDPSPKADPMKVRAWPGVTNQVWPVPFSGCGKATAGCGTNRDEYIGSACPCFPLCSKPSERQYWRRNLSTVGHSQHACHADIAPSHKSHTSTLSSQATAHRDLSHPLAAQGHSEVVAAFRTFFMGAISGVPLNAA